MTEEEKLAEEYRKELKERLLRDDDYERLEMFDENVEEAYLAGRKSNSEVIAELAKENAELKDYRLCTLKTQQTEMSKYALNLEHKLEWYDNKLTNAKEIIKELLESCFGYNSKTVNYEIKAKAEQFLKESEEMSAWHDNISPAALQRITTLSAFNDPQSKTLMLQTLYEELEKTIEDYKATNHSIASDYAELSKRAIKWQEAGKILPANCTCVLCALKDGGLETAYYEDGDFTFCAPAIHAQDVAAWAYIPEYKE